MQRPGNGRRRQSQDVQPDTPFFQPFLLGYAKPLFFVDHKQTEIFERHIRLQQPMGTDENIHASLRRPLQS